MPYKDPDVAREKARERQAKYRKKNQEKLRVNNLGRYHAYYKNTATEEQKLYRSEYLRKWRSNNPEKIEAHRKNEANIAKGRERAKKWQQKNKGRVRANNSMRKKAVKTATPQWFSKEMRDEVINIYEKAVQMERITGVKYHVDHIVPISSDKVCGLHVPWNLQVIPASDNLKKGNKF